MSCQQQSEEGVWLAADTSNSITRAEVRFNCQDQIHNGEPWPPGPPWYVHLWGKCHPSDCDWGEVGGRRLSSGVIYSTYDHGFARRGVYLQSVAPGELWLYVATHFTDNSGREDYDMELFLHTATDPNALRASASPTELSAFRLRIVGNVGATKMRVDANPKESGMKLIAPNLRRPLPVARARK